MTEQEFRRLHNTSFPAQLTEDILEEFDADPVLEGPQASNLEFWQYSQRQGVEQINGKWFTKYIAGPVFVDNEEATAAEQQAAYVAQKTAERNAALQQSIVTATQARLDAFARTRNYDSMLSACTYATSTVTKFQIEGQYCVEARDATWAALYVMLDDILSGARPMPSGFADIESELPVLAWPN
jgi:hypothetical protein